VATPRGGRESEELHAAARSWPEKKGGHTSAREVPLGKVAAIDSNPPELKRNSARRKNARWKQDDPVRRRVDSPWTKKRGAVFCVEVNRAPNPV
jgi:hypothetical protein